jgi:hypothetical protein
MASGSLLLFPRNGFSLLYVSPFSLHAGKHHINIPIHHPIIFVLRNWGTVIGRSFP